MPGRSGSRRSLGRRLLLSAAVHSVLVALAAVFLFAVQRDMQGELERATATFVSDHWIADRFSAAVMRQLAAAGAYQHNPDPALLATFREAGDAAAREIRRYLFRDLSAAQRLQLETVKERHQRMEVAAARSLELVARGRGTEAAEAAQRMADQGLALQQAIHDLVAMREADLERFRARQEDVFRYLYLTGVLFSLLLVASSLYWGRFLHRRLARPLERLGDAATRIGRGDLSVRVPVPAEKELAAVAGSFNRMADGLFKARNDLEYRNRQLEQTLEQLQETQAELVQTEKLSATGRMMAGLAHELNNPLASVLGFGQLLAERLDRDGVVATAELRNEFVAPLVSEAARAREIVHNLLRFTRKSEVGDGPVSLADAVDVVAGLRSYTLAQENVALEVDPVPDVWVRADAQRLQQVLVNVVNNAYDAVRGGSGGQDQGSGQGTVRVRFQRREGAVDIIVEDDGPGFAAPERVFEPFYTTKPVGEGTGLGLTLVHRFVAEAGGAVRVENRKEGGARVVLTLQEADEPSEPAPRTGPAPQPHRHLRILVVEDEAPLRTLQKRLLTHLGATVELAEGGHEARRILESRHDVDLVISDVKMPAGSGLELYRWVEGHRPELLDRFLFVTGDVGDPEIGSLAEQKPHQFVNKPFDKDDYLARVSALGG